MAEARISVCSVKLSVPHSSAVVPKISFPELLLRSNHFGSELKEIGLQASNSQFPVLCRFKSGHELLQNNAAIIRLGPTFPEEAPYPGPGKVPFK